MNCLAVCEFRPGSDCGLEIDQTNVGGHVVEDCQHLAPGPIPVHGSRNRPIGVFGQLDITAGITNIRLPQCRFAGMGKDLVYATPEHDVTTQQHRQHIRIAAHAGPPPSNSQPPTSHARAQKQVIKGSARRQIPVL
jgi:hypothetical protein